MENLLNLEQVAEQNVHRVLDPEYSIESLLQAFVDYRKTCEACIFTDIQQAEQHEGRLWQAHTDARRYLHKVLSNFRKQGEAKVVATRQVTKGFLKFIKDSQTFYRGYILKLNNAIGGIPELELVAQKVKHEGPSESCMTSISFDYHDVVLGACHRALVYLGDLSRYRATEKLDKNPDFGPAIGYYALACSLCPNSGMGHHQQAVVALEQRNHLRTIYHLYRAMTVEEPHPNAAKNLRIEFEKTNTAWDRGELIQKGQPNDPEAPQRTMFGWFIRLHSMCYKGQAFRGYDELERELISQFTLQLRQGLLGNNLFRLLMVNLAAQFYASENFQRESTNANQDAFLYFFRLNVRFFTVLLNLFVENLSTDVSTSVGESEEEVLVARLSSFSRMLLPGLRLYSSWLLANTHLVNGLGSDDFVSSAINDLWPAYGRAIDLIAAGFPIWDLDDLPEVTYMLEEDVETLGFRPLQHPRNSKIWHNKTTGFLRPRFSDGSVTRLSEDLEMLSRVKEFVSDGAFLTNDTAETPFTLSGTRFIYRGQSFELPVALQVVEPIITEKVAEQVPKPLSYAAAAAAARAPVNSVPSAAQDKNTKQENAKETSKSYASAASASNTIRQAQLSRMVDDLVDEEEGDNPKTPPQVHSSSPAVITNGDVSFAGMQDSGHELALSSYALPSKPVTPRSAMSPGRQTPTLGTANAVNGRGAQKSSSLWEQSPMQISSGSSHFPAGLPTGTLGSPAQSHQRGHSRVNSSSSLRSRHSPILADAWQSIDLATRQNGNGVLPGLGVAHDGYRKFSNSDAASPLLFGAGGSVWSAAPAQQYHYSSPPSGQPG